MFYRPGGSATRINTQNDTVYADSVNGATGWLPVSKGNTISVNIARASLAFVTAAASTITPSYVAPEAQVVMEMKMYGGDPDASARPIDQWQNIVVASSRRAHREGWVRLRIVNINNSEGTGIVMDMQIARTGDVGASTRALTTALFKAASLPKQSSLVRYCVARGRLCRQPASSGICTSIHRHGFCTKSAVRKQPIRGGTISLRCRRSISRD